MKAKLVIAALLAAALLVPTAVDSGDARARAAAQGNTVAKHLPFRLAREPESAAARLAAAAGE